MASWRSGSTWWRSSDPPPADEDLALLSFWDVVAEEFGERTLGEPDIEELAGCRTAVDLAETIARSFAAERTA
jgi:hypothetical protein